LQLTTIVVPAKLEDAVTVKSAFEPGNVVMLKSGGQALTVVSITAQGVQCIWIGEAGDLFNATLPAVALEVFDMDMETDDEPEGEFTEMEISEREEASERAA
jgi:uncharacterized protein YodC (DUF2158 family)